MIRLLSNHLAFIVLASLSFSLTALSNENFSATSEYIELDRLKSDDFISIVDGDSLFGDLGFENQTRLSDEILESIGNQDFDIDIIKKDFDISDKIGRFSLNIELGIDRQVFHRNFGEVDNNGQILSPLKSVYTIVDEARQEIRIEPNVVLNPYLNLQPLDIVAGVKVQRLYDVDNLEGYLNRRTAKQSLKNIGVELNKEKSEEFYNEERSNRILSKLSGALSQVEKIFVNAGDYFADEEQTKIFLQNVLDPLRLDYEFYNISADKIKNSNNIQAGEVIVHSTYLRYIPSGLRFRKSSFELEIDPIIRTIIIHSSFKKLDNGEVIAKSAIEIKKERRMELNYELFLGIKPFRSRIRESNHHLTEFVYEFDLKKPEESDAFDDIFAKRWFTKDIATLAKALNDFPSLQKSDYVTYSRDTRSLGPERSSKYRFEIGILAAYGEYNRSLDEIKTKMDNGLEYSELMGEVRQLKQYRFRLGIPKLRDSHDKERLLRSYVLVDNLDSGPSVELLFEYTFADAYSSQGENEKYINFIQMALASNELNEHSSAINNIHSILTTQRGSKSKKRDKQFYGVRLAFSSSLTDQIFSNPHSIDNLKYYVGKLFLGEEYQEWSDLDNITNHRENGDCSSLLPLLNSNLVFTSGRKMSCFLVRSMARNLILTFEEIQRTSNYGKRLELLNNLFAQKNMKPFIPMLMLQMAVTDKVDNGSPTYKDIDRMVQLKALGLELIVDGADLEAPIVINYNDTSATEAIMLPGDFDIITRDQRSNRLKVKDAYIKKEDLGKTDPKIYIHFTSPVDFSGNYSISGDLLEYRFVRADKKISSFTSSELQPYEVVTRNGDSRNSSYSYIFVIPQGLMNYRGDEDYIARFQINDANGNFVSEIQEAKFHIKQ